MRLRDFGICFTLNVTGGPSEKSLSFLNLDFGRDRGCYPSNRSEAGEKPGSRYERCQFGSANPRTQNHCAFYHAGGRYLGSG